LTPEIRFPGRTIPEVFADDFVSPGPASSEVISLAHLRRTNAGCMTLA
jgi:hypothetical protein